MQIIFHNKSINKRIENVQGKSCEILSVKSLLYNTFIH